MQFTLIALDKLHFSFYARIYTDIRPSFLIRGLEFAILRYSLCALGSAVHAGEGRVIF